MKYKKILLLVILLFIFILSCGKKKSTEKEYEVTNVTRGDIKLSVSKTGQVVSDNAVSVFTTASQRVQKVNFKEGDSVNEGDVVVTFYPVDKNETLRKIEIKNLEIKQKEKKLIDEQQALERKIATKNLEIQQKTRNLAVAENSMPRKVATKNFEIQQKTRSLSSAKNSLKRKNETKNLEIEQKARDLYNAEELYKVGGESKVNVENARKALREAQLEALATNNEAKDSVEEANISLKSSRLELTSTSEEAKSNVEEAKTALRTAKLELTSIKEEAKASIEEAKIALQSAKLELATLQEDLALIKDEIKSPVTGVITSMTADEDYKVNTETTLFKVADTKNIKVEINLSDSQIKDIQVNQRVEISSDALGEEKVIGYVSEVSGVATKSESLDESNTKVTIKFDDSKTLKPGTTVNAEIFYKESNGTLKVPYSSIISENDKYYAYKVGKDNRVSKAEVTVGVNDNSFYEILTGLTENDKIISVIDENLKDGEKIKIIDEKTAKKNRRSNGQQGFQGGERNKRGNGGPRR